MSTTQSTTQKALDINLDLSRYGSFAEIGAGQEVARQFFQAGKASQTIALTISAYDMTFSDIIYGKEKSGRYVCESRVRKMLDREYEKLVERLGSTRGKNTSFFAFADTVATGSEGKKNSHGWMGLKFQHKPGAQASEVVLHMRLLDRHRLQQQETLSILGVNLLHSSFYKTAHPLEFIEGLFDKIKNGAIAVDAIHFNGEAFKKFDEVAVNLSMVELGWSEAIFINAEGKVQNASDALWGKDILVQRAFYNPVTNTHLDVMDKGTKHFSKEFGTKASDIVNIFEFTLNNRLKNTKISVEEALKKVKMISSLKKPVLVSSFSLFYKLKEHLRAMSEKPLGIVIGATHLEKLFDEKFYFDLPGGILEGMGKLVDEKTRLYIYPHKTEQMCLQVKSFFPKPAIKHIYAHLIENKFIQDIAGCDEIQEFVHSDDILKLVKKKDNRWKKLVPESVQSIYMDQVKTEARK
ncbi:hypothetical protein [Pseudobdellovibrio sp. HCB154]|uniref:hypothetical protein n=1 Tax=Pseudobdellovibrio sp. HCB154 TaxID=3386277 RepID=UPI003916F0DC